jgi:DNA repair protein RadA/Sms
VLDGAAADLISVVAETDVGRIIDLAREARPIALIVDSIQTVTVDELDGPAGSVGQVRESALRLMEMAKGDGIAVILVGHVTKDGTLAGPKTLEHLVDAVLNLEGDRTATLRLLRATKNRFGSTEEVGVFEMAEKGMLEVADPGRAFLATTDEHAPGSVAGSTLEGTRPLLVEVQALVAPGGYGSPRRTASGIDSSRLALLVAVLGRRAGIGLGSHDVYANLAGGLELDDPGLDLPLCLACRETWSRSGKSGCSVSCGRCRVSSGGCVRLPAWASARPSFRDRAGGTRRSCPVWTSSPCRTSGPRSAAHSNSVEDRPRIPTRPGQRCRPVPQLEAQRPSPETSRDRPGMAARRPRC